MLIPIALTVTSSSEPYYYEHSTTTPSPAVMPTTTLGIDILDNTQSPDTTPGFQFCELLNSTICNDVLPYNLTYFPNALTNYANATELIAAVINHQLAGCSNTATLTMCYFLYPPCPAVELNVCRQDCLQALDGCQEFMRALRDFFNWKDINILRETCLSMPEEGCIRLPEPPSESNGKETIQDNGEREERKEKTNQVGDRKERKENKI